MTLSEYWLCGLVSCGICLRLLHLENFSITELYSYNKQMLFVSKGKEERMGCVCGWIDRSKKHKVNPDI